MSGFALKLLAAGTMLIDHVGAILFPQLTILRIIGRISFPLYCFLLCEGFAHTHSRVKYALRLALFALLSEPVYDYAFHGGLTFYAQNIFFTLLAGFCALWLIETMRARRTWLVYALCGAGVAALFWCAHTCGLDYGPYGVALICGYGMARQYPRAQSLPLCVLTLGYPLYGSSLQLAALGAAAVTPLYNAKPGFSRLKWLFYLFYPVHLLVLFWLSRLM